MIKIELMSGQVYLINGAISSLKKKDGFYVIDPKKLFEVRIHSNPKDPNDFGYLFIRMDISDFSADGDVRINIGAISNYFAVKEDSPLGLGFQNAIEREALRATKPEELKEFDKKQGLDPSREDRPTIDFGDNSLKGE